MYEFGHISHHIWLCVLIKVGDSQHSLPVSISPCFGCDSFGFTVLFFLIYKGLFSLLYIKQSAKCNVVNCKGNYNEENKCRVFRLPKDEAERQTWINKLPPRKDFVTSKSRYLSEALLLCWIIPSYYF